MRDRSTPARAVAALVTLSMSTFAYVTAETLPIGLLTPIADGLGTSPATVGLLVTGYGLVVVLASLPLTGLTHRLPRRPLLLALMGVFAVATLGSALAPNYGLLFLARVVTALAQALFWSIVVPVGAGLVPERRRGRAVSMLFAGSSLAGILGVPAGTWLGQQAGWRWAFVAVSAFGVVLLLLMALLLPAEHDRSTAADRGSEPDARRYRLVVVATALAVTGAFTAFTYVEPFMVSIAGLQQRDVSGVLLARGVAGIVGVVLAGALVDRSAWLVMFAATVAEGLALLAQYVWAPSPVVAVTASAVSSGALAMFAAGLGTRVLQVAPGPTDLAGAGTSTAFNVGITGGALVGSVLLSADQLRAVAGVGAAFAVLAVAVQLVEGRPGRRRTTGEPAGRSVAEASAGVRP